MSTRPINIHTHTAEEIVGLVWQVSGRPSEERTAHRLSAAHFHRLEVTEAIERALRSPRETVGFRDHQQLNAYVIESGGDVCFDAIQGLSRAELASSVGFRVINRPDPGAFRNRPLGYCEKWR